MADNLTLIHSQRKRKLKILKKFFTNQNLINVAPFNKDIAPGKKTQKLISVPVCLFRTLEQWKILHTNIYVLSKQLHCNYVNPVSENFFKIMKSDKIFCSRWLNPICITVDQLFNKDEKLTVSDLHSLSLEDGTK